MSQNLYDNEKFFNLYKELRCKSISANNLEEKPELISLLPDLKDKKSTRLGMWLWRVVQNLLRNGSELC